MAGIVSCLTTSAVFCFCSAAGSLLSACCGNDKPSTVDPGASSGRKRSVLLLVLAIALAFCFQYWVAPMILSAPIDNLLSDAWRSGCDDLETAELVERCAGNAGVYRTSFSAVIFYLLAGIAVYCKRTMNREAWPAKYILFLFLVAGMCFIPNDPLFLTIHLNVARIGGVIFIIFQQIVFVDIAMNWNDGWVENSNRAEEEERGSGQKWLYAILASAIFLFAASLTAWVLLFVYFGNCGTNTAFIVITILLCVLITLAQLSGTEGSLLSSATITAYATMLCYSAVTKNDDEECNPNLGEDDVLGIIIGVGLTVVTLAYAAWSATADEKLSGRRDEEVTESNENVGTTSESNRVSGIVTNAYGTSDKDSDYNGEEMEKAEENVPRNFSNSWKLNFVLASVSCWYAMALTGWGSIESGGNVADPLVGKTSMWLIVGSQWFILALYLWTLIAPRLFPDRDFS